MSTVDEYKQAMNELAAATTEFQPVAKFLTQLADASHHKMSLFLQANFQMRSSGSSPRDLNLYRVNLDNWPTAERVKAAGKRIAIAFNNAHKVYNELPQEDKEFVKLPPSMPDLK